MVWYPCNVAKRLSSICTGENPIRDKTARRHRLAPTLPLLRWQARSGSSSANTNPVIGPNSRNHRSNPQHLAQVGASSSATSEWANLTSSPCCTEISLPPNQKYVKPSHDNSPDIGQIVPFKRFSMYCPIGDSVPGSAGRDQEDDSRLLVLVQTEGWQPYVLLIKQSTNCAPLLK